MNTSKRHRTVSDSSSSSSAPAQHTSKASRTSPGPDSSSTTHPLLCTLPPTCIHNPTPLANTKDLESHYANYHAHVCEERGCNCVFPDARLLELHQTECHDPIAAVRKDRGEKIFACHLASCPRLFLAPKARRLHLIQAHAYPKEYFFAVTNKGVGGLLKRWGEGASMVRGEWKPREQKDHNSDDEQSNIGEEDAAMADEDQDIREQKSFDSGPHVQPRGRRQEKQRHQGAETVDALADSLNSLSLVPPSIRFGRGGKNGGFVNHHHHGSSAGRGLQPPVHGSVASYTGSGSGHTEGGVNAEPGVNTEVDVSQYQPRNRGFGGRGRGRGRGRAGFDVPLGRGGRGRVGWNGRVGVARGRGSQ